MTIIPQVGQRWRYRSDSQRHDFIGEVTKVYPDKPEQFDIRVVSKGLKSVFGIGENFTQQNAYYWEYLPGQDAPGLAA